MTPAGDQPQAIEALVEGLSNKQRLQVLLGATGTGKTFTLAKVIERAGRPTLVMAHNKTLAAQLYGELAALFPENAVRYFVSYYDYYQPEAYVPSTDTFIEKDSSINDEIDRMRHAATHALLTRDDVIIVASVSCIYGLGTAEAYFGQSVSLALGQSVDQRELLARLVDIQYERGDYDFHRGSFRVRGDTIEIFPIYEEDRAIRIEFFGDEVEAITEIDPLRGKVLDRLDKISIFPGSHYVTAPERREAALRGIEEELEARLRAFRREGKLLEAQRIEQRTRYDIDMIQNMGFCPGVENYSRWLSGRKEGDPPPTLLEYFPKNFLMILDESHQTVPQIGAMYRGDQARKTTLVDYGFRLPSALDNRPLKFDEWEGLVNQAIFVSATPGPWELDKVEGVVVEQVIRPTGLIDPKIEVRPVAEQVDDLLEEIRRCVELSQRVLVTTLTKRMAEDLTEYFAEVGVKVRYLHSDIATMERSEILRELRSGDFDVLVGINLLREGLDLPEVSLVAVLDADKEGFLRSETSLIQTVGRAARHIDGRVIFYADKVTRSMKAAIDETDRRREKQAAYNEAMGITPRSVISAIRDLGPAGLPIAAAPRGSLAEEREAKEWSSGEGEGFKIQILRLEKEMRGAADALDFERAASLRDQLRQVKQAALGIEGSVEQKEIDEIVALSQSVAQASKRRRNRRSK